MPTGIIKWFNPKKGYGFVTPEDGSKDAFVHITAVQGAGLDTLNEGDKIEYELVEGQNGKKPKNLYLYLSRSKIFHSEKYDIDVNLSEI